MGDILHALGIGGKKPSSSDLAAVIQHVGGGVTPGDEPIGNSGQGPTDPLAPLPSSPTQQSSEESPITIQGDTWKPKKGNLLTFLADVVNHHYGNGYLATELLNKKNTESALSGYTDNPLEAIRRLQMVDGQSNKALDLYNTYVDNKRADDQAQAIIQARKDKARDRIGSMMSGLNSDNYSKMLPTLRRYAEDRGLDPSEVPDTYDPDQISTYRNGAMSVDAQTDNARADDNLDSMKSDRAARLGIARERLGQTGADTQSRIDLRRERINKLKNPSGGNSKTPDAAKARANKAFRTAAGSLVEYDKTGNKMKVTDKQGRVGYFTMGVNGKPVFVGRE